MGIAATGPAFIGLIQMSSAATVRYSKGKATGSRFFRIQPIASSSAARPAARGSSYSISSKRIVRSEGKRSEERRVGKSVSVRVDLGGRRIIKKKKTDTTTSLYNHQVIT